MMQIYELGLIGFPISHSFSERYFKEKFLNEKINNFDYFLFPLENLDKFPVFIKNNPKLVGLNVTIPHKKNIIPFLDELDSSALRVGAVNVIKIFPNGKKIGYNSDYFGFKKSLETLLHTNLHTKNTHLNNLNALILGNGGATMAVVATLQDLKIHYEIVSRQKSVNTISYNDLTTLKHQKPFLQDFQLIINTTPLGMYPHTEFYPQIPYEYVTNQHILYDLVYNPEETTFLKKGRQQGASTKNGLEMLYLQAEKSWEIWQ